jgi:hypothetical protein
MSFTIPDGSYDLVSLEKSLAKQIRTHPTLSDVFYTLQRQFRRDDTGVCRRHTAMLSFTASKTVAAALVALALHLVTETAGLLTTKSGMALEIHLKNLPYVMRPRPSASVAALATLERHGGCGNFSV